MLPAATRAVIWSSTVRSLVLWHWVDAILSAWRSGVPELTRVESWWKNISVSSSLADLWGFFETRAGVTTQSSNRKWHLPWIFSSTGLTDPRGTTAVGPARGSL